MRHRRAFLFALVWIAVTISAQETSAPTVTLRLENGTTLVGSVLGETADRVKMLVVGIGEIDVDRSAVVERVEGTVGVQVNVQDMPPVEVPTPASKTEPGVKWTRTVRFGGDYTSAPFEQGPVEGTVPGITGSRLGLPGTQLTTQFRATIQRVTAKTDWWLGASAMRLTAQPRGALVQQEQIGSEVRRTITPKWYALSLTKFNRDRVRHIDDSVAQIIGIGRRVVETPRYRFDLVGGVEAERSHNGTIFDGEVLHGFGAMETFHFGTNNGVGLDQRVLLKKLVEGDNLYSIESYLGLNAPLSKHLALTVSFESSYDKMLNLKRTDIPANAFFPGSPAASFFANTPWLHHLTTGIEVRF